MSLLWGMVILKPSSVRNAGSACVRDGTSSTEYSAIACEGEEAVMDKRRHRVPDGVPDDGKTAKLHFKALL